MAGRRAVKKESLPEMIASDLRQRILSGELVEGEAIRQELLAQEYDVSRMPVREALKRLSAEGLVHWENNRGGTVVKHSLPEIGEIFDLRILIEVDLFRRAIPRMTERYLEPARACWPRWTTPIRPRMSAIGAPTTTNITWRYTLRRTGACRWIFWNASACIRTAMCASI